MDLVVTDIDVTTIVKKKTKIRVKGTVCNMGTVKSPKVRVALYTSTAPTFYGDPVIGDTPDRTKRVCRIGLGKCRKITLPLSGLALQSLPQTIWFGVDSD